jgi:hypothetical protein
MTGKGQDRLTADIFVTDGQLVLASWCSLKVAGKAELGRRKEI